MKRLLLAAGVIAAMVAPAQAAVTCSTTTDTIATFAADTTPDITYGAAPTAGDFLFWIIYWTTNETSTITAGPSSSGITWVNASGPIDHPNTTLREFAYYAVNSTAAAHVVTTTVSDAVGGRVGVGSCTGASTLAIDTIDTTGSTQHNSATHTTDAISSTAARDGVLIDLIGCNTTETLNSVDAGSTAITGLVAERIHMVVKPFTGGATNITLQITFADATQDCTHQTFIALEPAAGGTTPPPGIMMRGVGR